MKSVSLNKYTYFYLDNVGPYCHTHNMAHLHKKMKKGRPYYYIRENRRVGKKTKVANQIYLGTVERIAEVFRKDREAGKPARIRTEEYGSLLIANELEKEFETIGLIDDIVPRGRNEKGPTVGEYFYFAWMNRLIAPKSKRALADWYKKTAIQIIHPVALAELNSLRYWQKWDRVSEKDIEQIGMKFFTRIWKDQKVPPEAALLDTTNLFTYMSSATDSDLCKRGKNKDSKHHLRQVGVGVMVDRETELPLYFKIYPGNEHDSKVFHRTIDEMFGVLCKFNKTKQRLTVVFDKGMNSEENIGFFDDNPRIHFITTYSPYFVEELATTDIAKFQVLDIEKNRVLEQDEKLSDRVLAYRTTLELWGKARTVIVTHNPKTYRKKQITLNKKLDAIREELLEFRKKYRAQEPHWRDKDTVLKRYERLCERLHIGSQYYRIDFGDGRMAPDLSFRRDFYEIQIAEKIFGRNVIVSDNHDWPTEEIVQKSLDRYKVENTFKKSKKRTQMMFRPFFHWTDSKIRCQLLCCVMTLTMSRLLELKIQKIGLRTALGSSSSEAIMEEMRSLDSVLLFYPDRRKAERVIEDPTDFQIGVLKAFGYQVDAGGVLQKI